MNDTFSGAGVALVTPFNEKLEVDYAGLKNLLEHTANGSDYWVVHGTTGESVTTTTEEKIKILDFVKKHNHASLPIVVGVGGNYTEEVVKKLKAMDLDGIDGILSVSPYYNKPPQKGIYEHFVKIADASPKPVILYNVPGRTGSNIAAETALALADHKNIVGIKESSCNLEQVAMIAKYKPSGFKLISGDDMFTIPLMSVGGEGAISVLANAFPYAFGEMTRSMLSGDLVKAREYMFQLLELHPLMYVEGSPSGIKQALELLNVCRSYVRLPMVQVSEKLKNQIAEKMRMVRQPVQA